MKRGEGVPRQETDRILRDVDRQLRSLTTAAVERVLRTAAPGLGGGFNLAELRQATWSAAVERSWQTEVDTTLGCTDHRCACTGLAENWEEIDRNGSYLAWAYRRAGRWRVLEAPGWNRDRPRRAWQYDYWRIEDARRGDGADDDLGSVPDAVDGPG